MNVFEIIGATIGLFYIVSEYRADRWFWPLSLLMSAFYAVIDFTSGIYANGAICVYNFLMSIYGIMVWRGIIQKRKEDQGDERHISSCPKAYWWQIITVIVALSALLTWLLGFLNQSTYTLPSGRTINLAVLDGISSALTIVGMLMLAHKWWFVVVCRLTDVCFVETALTICSHICPTTALADNGKVFSFGNHRSVTY